MVLKTPLSFLACRRVARRFQIVFTSTRLNVIGRFLLWGFLTGDRADGGLRHIAAENGCLTIELYGKDTRIGGKLFGSEPGLADCCAMSVTRTNYRWRNG